MWYVSDDQVGGIVFALVGFLVYDFAGFFVFKEIEDNVKAAVVGGAANRGVLFKGMDIKEISMPDDVREKIMARWSGPLERELRIREAETNRETMIVESEGRARSIEHLDRVKLASSARMAQIVDELAKTLPKFENEAAAYGFLRLVRDLASRIGQDETSAMYELEMLREWLHGGVAERSASPGPMPAGLQILPSSPMTALQDGVKDAGSETNEGS